MRFAHRTTSQCSPRGAARPLICAVATGIALAAALSLWPALSAEAAAPVVSGPPTIQFSQPGYTVDGNAGLATVEVILSDPAPGQTATVQYSARGISPAGSGDYAAVGGSLTFGPGQDRQALTIPVKAGSPGGPEQVVALVLGQATQAILGDPSVAILTVTGDGAPDVSPQGGSLGGPRPTVQFSSSAYAVSENAATAIITATLLNPAPDITVTVDYASGDITAVAGSDYTAVNDTLTFAPGQTTQTFAVPIINDAINEPAELLSLILSNVSANAILGSPTVALLTIHDEDPLPTVQFNQASYSVAENAGTATVTVTLNIRSEQNVLIDYATSDGTAYAGSDYTAVSGTLTFPPGEITETFDIPIIDDLNHEHDQTAALTLSNPTNATIAAPNPATLTIIDNDPVPTVQFASGSAYSVAESGGQFTLAVTLSLQSEVTATVAYSTSPGTAAASVDYTPVSGSLTFTPGVTSQVIAVPILNDALYENDETLTLQLSNPGETAIAGQNPATLTILNDDPVPTLQFSANNTYSVTESGVQFTLAVTLSAPSELTATVAYTTSPGTAAANVDYTTVNGSLTFTPGVTSRVITVPILNDALYENDETLTVQLGNPVRAVLAGQNPATLTILDNDPVPTLQFSANNVYSASESGVQFTLAVTLSAPSALTATVAYNTSPGTAAANADYTPVSGSLTFTPGVTSQVIAVPILNDALYENDETLAVQLSNPVRAVLAGQNPVTLTILNDDPVPTLQFSANNVYNVTESGVQFTLAVTLSAPSELTATVAYSTSPGTAAANVDYTTVNGSLTFTPGVTSQLIHVPILNDTLYENDETLSLQLSNPFTAVVAGQNPVTLTIFNDDPPPTAQFSAASAYSVSESGGQFTLAVTLTTASALTATVEYSTTAGTAAANVDYSQVSGSLTFTPGVTSQVIAVPILNDALYENDETLSLHLGNPQKALIGGQNPVTLTILNDDPVPTLQFSANNVYGVSESGVQFTLAVTLSAPSALTATVEYSTTAGTAAANVDYSQVSGSLTFTPGVTSQVIHVPILNDALLENAETLSLHLGNPAKALIGGQNPATLTILNDDPAPTAQFETSAYTVGEGDGQVTITVTLNTVSELTAQVGYATSDGSATAGQHYTATTGTLTFLAGITRQSFSVGIIPNPSNDPTRTFYVVLQQLQNATTGAPALTAVDILDDNPLPQVIFNQSSYGRNRIFGTIPMTVELTSPSGTVVALVVSTQDQTAVQSVDYVALDNQPVVFNPGVTQVNVGVTLLQKPCVVDGPKTLVAVLSSPNNATLGVPYTATLTIEEPTCSYLPMILK